ncbi:hypothetical protein V7056_09035 [Bacillus sp. JJ664]
MKKLILASAMVSALTFGTISVGAQEVDWSKFNPKHNEPQHHGHPHHHDNKHHELLNKHKKEVVKYISNYVNQPEANVNKLVNDQKIEMKKLIFVAVVSKLSNQPMENIIAAKKENKSFKDLLSKYNIDHEQFHNEMKRVHEDLFTRFAPKN